MDDNLHMIETLLSLTQQLHATKVKKGEWAAISLLAEIGVAHPHRRALVNEVEELGKISRLLDDVEVTPRAKQDAQYFMTKTYAFYEHLYCVLPATMTTCN